MLPQLVAITTILVVLSGCRAANNVSAVETQHYSEKESTNTRALSQRQDSEPTKRQATSKVTRQAKPVSLASFEHDAGEDVTDPILSQPDENTKNRIVDVDDAPEPPAEEAIATDDSKSDNQIDDKEPTTRILKVPEGSDSQLPLLLPAEAVANNDNKLTLASVIASVHQSFPLLEVAYVENDVVDGKQLAAWGAFDTKLKATSENGPTGFYQTYRNSTGVVRPLYGGGEVFGGYRIGRGDFQPWYRERRTNDGGELKAGLRIPLVRNREIDARRAELWRATYDQQRTRPEIRAQLIMFVRDASYAYWKWIAAGHQYEVGRRVLQLAEKRNGQLRRRVENGDLDPPVLQDNLRAIAERESKLIDLKRKLQQAAIKLSLFSRASDGTILTPSIERLVEFPSATNVFEEQQDIDLQTALQQRPELIALDAMYRRASVDLAEAQNGLLPMIDAQLAGSQDVGAPSSIKRDKSEFELDAGLFVDIPIQRRSARGKTHAAHAKLRQISTKKRFTEDKITTEVRFAFTALRAAFGRIDKAREARRLAEYMADIERRKFDLGESDLLKVVLREQYAVDAAEGEIDATLEYFYGRADYSAALANHWPVEGVAPDE